MALHAWKQRPLRVSFHRPVLVKLRNQHPQTFAANAVNLSQAGMFLSTPETVAAGSEIDVALVVSGKVLPFAHAVVLRASASPSASEQGLAIRFTSFHHRKGLDLVDHLVSLLDQDLPIQPARAKPKKSTFKPARWMAAMLALSACAALTATQLQNPESVASSTPHETPAAAEDFNDAERFEQPAPPATTQKQRRFYLSSGPVGALTLTEENETLSVHVETRRPVAAVRTRLSNPSRLVIDLNARLTGPNRTTVTGLDTAHSIAISKYRGKTRIIVSLSDNAKLVDEVKPHFELASAP